MNNKRDPEFLKLFGNRLRELRKQHEISQEELAGRADLHLSQIGRIERGEINATVSTVNVIAQALDIHRKELFDF